MDIGEAVKNLKGGKRVTRKGWNGKNMWLQYVKGMFNDDGINLLDCVVMKTVQDTIVPWVCSQTDLLADDYHIVA